MEAGVPDLGYALDHIPDAVATFDPEFRYTYLNRAATELAGMPAESLLGKSVWDLFAPMVGTLFYRELHLAAAERVPRHFEEYYERAGRWLEFDAYPTAQGLILITRDVTAAKQAAIENRNRDERLNLALSFANMGVWEYDLKKDLVHWSPELEAIHGLSPGTFDGRHASVAALVHPDDFAGLRQAYADAIQHGGVLAHEFRVVWPDGSVHYLYSRGKAIRDQHGHAELLLGVTVEITDRKLAARELQSKLEQLELLFDLAKAVSRAQSSGEIYQAAAEGLVRAVSADRAAVLIFDSDGVMRFKASAGLSAEYRAAVERHSPWGPGTRDAQPITVPDVARESMLAPFSEALANEGIRALAFIPLLGKAGLIGKFMLYYDAPHQFCGEEIRVAQTIASQVTFATERQIADAALRESEERFRAIFVQKAIGVCVNGLHGEWLRLNEGACEILGYTEDELRGRSFLDVTHPDDREACLAAIGQLQSGEMSSYLSEKRYVRKDGRVIWARVFAAPVHDREGCLLYFIAVMEDITARVQAESALRESERRLIQAQRAAHIGVWDCDLRTNITVVSEEYGRLHGLAPGHGALSHKEWLAGIYPEDRERVSELLRDCLERTRVWDTEFRVVWPDGSMHWLLGKGQVFLDGAGRPIRMAGVTLDITERKQAEAALRESEERFRYLADTAPVMIWMIGADRQCTFFNRSWLEFTGRAMEQELGRGWMEGIHPDDLDACRATYASAFGAQAPFRMEGRLRRADGEYRSLLCSFVPRFTRSNVFEGYLGSSLDITDFKRTQEQVLATQKLESLGVLASGVAHDFNNLLGSILADSELLLGDLAKNSDVREGAERIKTVAIRAAEIVRELMAYAGQENPVLAPVDLSNLVTEMLHLLKVSISKRATLNLDLPPCLPAVLGSAAQICQVVLNLITNASEALGQNEGTISVAVSRVTAPEQTGEYVRLSVSDTGCGMSPEVQARIFDPFYSTKFAGRGLGLAAVQGIVRGHGGTIQVTTAPGQGSRFEILLPCTVQNTLKQAAVRPDAASDVSDKTILVVEDEDSLRLAVSRMLQKRGYTVIEAADGRAAVDLFRANQSGIDLVLLDMTLPGIAGQEVLSELRRLNPAVSVVLTSAYGQDVVLRSLGAQEPCPFIRKPYLMTDLVGLLGNAGGPNGKNSAAVG